MLINGAVIILQSLVDTDIIVMTGQRTQDGVARRHVRIQSPLQKLFVKPLQEKAHVYISAVMSICIIVQRKDFVKMPCHYHLKTKLNLKSYRTLF